METRRMKGGGSIAIVYEDSGCWRQLEVDRFIPATNKELLDKLSNYRD